MNATLQAYLVIALLALSSLVIVINLDWRVNIFALAAQYVGVFLLVAGEWPTGMALTKLAVGWMAAAVLMITRIAQKEEPRETSWPSGRVFRLLAAGLVLLTVWSASAVVAEWLPNLALFQIQAGLILIGMGLLQLGLTAQPLRVTIGLLTLMAGFEIIYAAVEISLLVAGLLAGVNLGLAFFGAYLITAPSQEEHQ
ncbi:MAG: hypothetical protein M1281_19830 [Chloroflexi bacterium]|nr:hypothetical protein [Chloroflexota bacterium]